MSLLMLFIDGVGIGSEKNNPLVETGSVVLSIDRNSVGKYNYSGGVAKAVDANLGVEGLPQSATGQTAIFTGKNTARLIGRHLSGWPSPRLRQLLKSDSIFIRLLAAGRLATFANAFTPAYFLRPLRRMSASTLHMIYAGLKPRWIWQISDGKAVFQDFTNRMLIESGFDIPAHTPEQAGENLAGLLEEHDLVLYEFFLTDAAAHGRIDMDAGDVIIMLDRMLAALLEVTDLKRHSVLLCSDHGNIEDPGHRGHTRNPVPLIAWGAKADSLLDGVDSIDRIADSVVGYFL